MDTQEALRIINESLTSIKNREVTVTVDTDMLEAKILDSLDCLLLIMDIDSKCGISVPEDADLVNEGYFKVSKLISLLTDR